MLRVVEVENGLIQGLPAADPRITSFKGIPFAAPPIGKNRWRAPQPAKNWEGIRKAYEFSAIPMQAPTVIDINNIYTREWAVDPDIPMSEDCLYLNVWTPAVSSEEKLPVYVWYFGGGLQVGHTAEMEFDGERIARRGIVVVTVSYRLNVFGFLCHTEITTENPLAPANFGHLDQQAGTKWVKRNIAAFGGDPDNITIGGQSAGGGSVLSQLTSPQNEGLFHKAVVHSGIITKLYPGNRMPINWLELQEAEKDGRSFFEYLGVTTLSEARKLSAEYINKKALESGKMWSTVIDQRYSIGNAFDLIVEHKYWRMPIMIGHTSSEFMMAPKASTIEELKNMANDLFREDSKEYLKLCRANTECIEAVRNNAAVRSIEYAIRVAAHAIAGDDSSFSMYYYNFDADIPGWDNPGTFHSVDLWFFFETLAKCWRPFVGRHYDLARQMCNYLTNFIRNGDPNGKDVTEENMPYWEPYTRKEPYGMVFSNEPEFVREEPSEMMRFLIREFFLQQFDGKYASSILDR
jgi:para-nitrobenzyl esterase